MEMYLLSICRQKRRIDKYERVWEKYDMRKHSGIMTVLLIVLCMTGCGTTADETLKQADTAGQVQEETEASKEPEEMMTPVEPMTPAETREFDKTVETEDVRNDGIESEETTFAKKETTEYMVAPILTAGEPPFTNMRYIYSVNNPDGGYYYEDITEDGYTTVINHAHVSWLDDYGEDIEYYMSYGAWMGLSDDPGSIRDLYMEKNEVYSEKLGCPVYVLSFKTGLKENTSCWTVFAAEAYGYTYLYAFDVWAGASEGMDEIIADYFNRLALVDVSDPPVGNTQ